MKMQRIGWVTLVVASATLSGCLSAAMQQRDENLAAAVQAGQQYAAAAQADAHLNYYVTADRAWACPDAAAALRNGECQGGKRYVRNQAIVVIGQPANGLYRTSQFTAAGEQRHFILATAVNELPDLAALESSARTIAVRYPATKQIPPRNRGYVDFIEQPKAFDGRYLVFQQPTQGITCTDAPGGKFSCTIPVPERAGSQRNSLAQFDFHNQKVASDFRNGVRSYRCGAGYCDQLVIVARLTGKSVDRVTRAGYTMKLPLFEVVELADRFGHFTRD